jgi:adenosylcobinamide-GDP ribazoletransferase
LSRAALWFPAVGVVVGGFAAGVRWAAGLALPAGAATVLALAAAAVVTGALHEDGLADTADAIGAHTSRERRLEILRDPRLGTYGALAVAFMFLFPYARLNSVTAEDFARAAIAGHALARWATLPQALLVAPARRGGAGSLLRPRRTSVAVATSYSAAIAVAAGRGWPGAVAFGVAAVVALGVALAARRSLGGATGDTLGAGAKLVELAVYGALIACW